MLFKVNIVVPDAGYMIKVVLFKESIYDYKFYVIVTLVANEQELSSIINLRVNSFIIYCFEYSINDAVKRSDKHV